MLNAVILATVVAIGALQLHPRVANARLWRATITPLASIIGSGFLVLGPILNVNFGYLAPLAMLALVAVGYFFGAAIRYNIGWVDSGTRGRGEALIDTLSSWVLAFAYIISVAYYLNLFGAFGVSLTSLNDNFHARLLTTSIFVLILFVGWTRGFFALERLEQLSVGIKLAIIAGMLVGLAIYFFQTARDGALVVNPPAITGWPALAMMFGLIVTVQGFETSRYLGDAYDAPTRIRSMRLAQIVSAGIYLIYIGLVAYVFAPGTVHLSETAIIQMMQIVAPILPVLLVGAALSAQFSAAVADTSGSGGLLVELSRRKLQPHTAYALLVGIGLILTWTSNIYQIISYASRAFAAYYALQAAIAALASWRHGHRARFAAFALLCLLGIVITIFAKPVE